jgi:hypothetical protein
MKRLLLATLLSMVLLGLTASPVEGVALAGLAASA